MKNRTLYFGDNLEILRKKIPDESFDLIYLDPPFNSNRSYNILFKEGLQDSPAQIKAFEDSWHWTRESKNTFDYLVTKANENISNLMLAMEKVLGHNDVLAYLTIITIRLIELKRVLKQTGTLYLHCDPTASHYLKIVLDVIFGKKNFRNEIIWKRQTAKKGSQFEKRSYGSSSDTILFYTKSDDYYFNIPTFKLSKKEMEEKFNKIDKNGRKFRLDRITLPRIMERKNLIYEYKGYMPQYGWMMEETKLRKFDAEGRLFWTQEGKPYRKYFMDEYQGQEVSNIWTDISVASGNESLGYATQKPEALLERIIKASSKEGDWALDPFCGCGTTVAAAEKLDRKWVGIDITALAINLIRHRLRKQFGLGTKQINVDGLPKDLNGTKALFKKDPFEFEYWVLDLVNAMPAQSKSKEKMRGADKGIDGVITFIKNVLPNGNSKKNGNNNGNFEYGKALVQVKGGRVQRNQIAALKGDIEREKAEAGVFITLEEPTRPMIQEAIDAGSFKTPITNNIEFPKIQILAVEELLRGKKPNLPQGLIKNYYKEAKPSGVKSKNIRFKLL